MDIIVRAVISNDPGVTGSGRVDYGDFTVMASQWMRNDCVDPNWCGGADLDGSGGVNIDDIKIMVGAWLS